MVMSVLTGMVQGVEGIMVQAETDISAGLPMTNLFGSLSPEAREGKERVRTALKNIGIRLPPSRITINLAPGDIRKSGTAFDLAIAVSLLLAMKLVPEGCADGILFLGELSLDGGLLPVHGVLPVLKTARDSGISRCLVPFDNLPEASLLEDMKAAGFRNLKEVFDYLKNKELCHTDNRSEYNKLQKEPITCPAEEEKSAGPASPDFADIRGQELAKRALEISVAGFHNVHLEGPPGIGKSMIASCVPGIMPEMNMEEKLETTMIYSVRGLLGKSFFLVENRPFRSPSHNITMMGLFGGGRDPVPGEISLAHHGVLFLDEFPEYSREKLEMLRVPLEDHKIALIRNSRTIEFPADFILIAASNPCPCGYYPDRNRCRCSEWEIRRYQNKISGPMRDRMDLFVRCEEVNYEELTQAGAGESSVSIRERACRAWEIQRLRYKDTSHHFNGRMTSKDVTEYCRLTDEGNRMLASAYTHFRLSGRAYFRILKVARTIADLEGDERISTGHLEEALVFRNVCMRT